MEVHFDLTSQVVDTVDVTSLLDAGNSAVGTHCDANEANEEEKNRLLHKLQQLARNLHESPILPLTSETDHTSVDKDKNLENNGRSGEPIKSKESNEEDFRSSTEFQSLIAKVVMVLHI